MNNPFAAPAALVLGLVFLFSGERLFGDDPTFRIVLDVLGVSGVIASFVTRGRRASGAETAADQEIRKWIAWIHVGIVVALFVYAIQLPAPLAKLGFTAGDAEKGARAVLGTFWPIALVISTLTALFLDAALISSRRMPVRETLRIRASAQTGAVLGMLVSIFAIGNYLAAAHSPETDLSRRKVGRPSEATIEVVKNLESPLILNVFFPPSNEVELEIEPYLRALESGAGGKILVHHWDHALDPKIAKRVNARDNGAIYITRTSLEEGTADGDPPAVPTEKLQLGLKADSAKSTLKKFDAELQKRLLKLARGSRKIYFTSGHGERNAKGGSNIDKEDNRSKLSMLNRHLVNLSYEVKPLSATEGLVADVPADAAAVVIAGPTAAFLDAEVDTLERYFDRGGSLLVLLEPEYPAGAPAALLDHLGVTWDPTLLGNERPGYFLPETRSAADKTFLLTDKASSHASVTTISRHKGQLVVLVPHSGSVAKKDGTARNTQLVLSPMPGTFRDVNGNFTKDADAAENVAVDKMAFAAAVEGDKAEGAVPGKALVVASAELIGDKWLQAVLSGTAGSGNAAFAIDGLKWLVGDEKLQAPVALSDEDIPIKHTTKEDTIWFYATIFLAPAMVLAGGLGWVGRTRRRRPEPEGRGAGGPHGGEAPGNKEGAR